MGHIVATIKCAPLCVELYKYGVLHVVERGVLLLRGQHKWVCFISIRSMKWCVIRRKSLFCSHSSTFVLAIVALISSPSSSSSALYMHRATPHRVMHSLDCVTHRCSVLHSHGNIEALKHVHENVECLRKRWLSHADQMWGKSKNAANS